MSYGMISILRIGSLRSPPPIRLCRTFPLCRGQNKTPRDNLPICGSIVSPGYSATVHILHRMCKLVKVSPKPAHKRAFLLIDQPNCGGGKGTGFIGELQAPRESSDMLPTGQGGGASHQRGKCISRPSGRLYGFRRQRRHLYWRPKGRPPRQRARSANQ